MKKKYCFVVLILALALVLPTRAYSKSEKVDLYLNFKVVTTHAFIIVGIDKGFYTDEGIELKLISGRGSSRAIKAVAMGEAPFGLASGATLLTLKSKSKEYIPVKALATLNQNGMTAFFFSKELAISAPRDLKGKSIAVEKSSLRRDATEIFLSLHQISENEVKFVNCHMGQGLKTVLLNQAQIAPVAIDDGIAKLKTRGVLDQYNFIFLEHMGVSLLGISVIVNEGYLKKNPELVRRFIKATLKSWNYADQHPQEAVQSLVNYKLGLKIKIEEIKINEIRKWLIRCPETEGKPLGWMSEKKWKRTAETLIKAGKIMRLVDLTTIYTNEFIEK